MSKLAHSNQATMDKIEARSKFPDMEAEANQFAMELLMPADWLRADIKKMGGIDIEDESKVKKLARRYRVSNSIMALRIGQLIERGGA